MAICCRSHIHTKSNKSDSEGGREGDADALSEPRTNEEGDCICVGRRWRRLLAHYASVPLAIASLAVQLGFLHAQGRSKTTDLFCSIDRA